MASIRNVQWARLAIVLIALGVVVATFRALPVLEGIHDVSGTRLTALFAVGLMVFVAVTLFPAWWPWWRARRARLSRPWLFVLVVWGFSSGISFAVFALVAVPAGIFQIFLLPQLVEMELLSHRWNILGDALELEAFIVAVLQIVAAVIATRVLSRRWLALQPLWDAEAS